MPSLWGSRRPPPAQVFCNVMERMRQARASVAHHDDPKRCRRMGAHVDFGTARFVAIDTLEVEGVGRLKSKRIIVATGARPAIPPIPSLEEAGYQTHETIFDLQTHPERVGMLGTGPIGLEFSQVFSRLGSEVVVLEMLDRILPSENPDVAEALLGILRSEGIEIELGARVVAAQTEGVSKVIVTEDGRRFLVDEILVATGRRPKTEGLDLERAGIEREGNAIRVDSTLRTSNRGVWADGDLGHRMWCALRDGLEVANQVCVVGTDGPDLDAALVEEAFDGLSKADVVIGPATDGGYYLLAIQRPIPELFEGIPWSTPTDWASPCGCSGPCETLTPSPTSSAH